MFAFGAKADIDENAAMSANDPKRTFEVLSLDLEVRACGKNNEGRNNQRCD